MTPGSRAEKDAADNAEHWVETLPPVLPDCPNADDPFLCSYDFERQRFIPEAGCPRHDPNERRSA